MTDASRLRAGISARVGALAIDAGLDTGPGTLVIVGPNGAGKTTLLSLLLGVRPVARGRIEAGGVVLLDTDASIDVPLEERRLAYVPQDYALFPHLSVRANVDFALSNGTPRLSREERAHRAQAVLRELELEALAERRPQTLSGGEKQRAALARAVSVRPRALLLDEPLAALDVHSRRTVRDFLSAYLRALALPTIVVTHDPADARLLGDRIAVLESGRVTQCGTWEELAASPASPFVEAFVAPAR